jgi:hypothetical protein
MAVMTWVFLGEKPVNFDEEIFETPLIGDELIRVEHVFNGATFPGLGYAQFSNIYNDGERGFFRRSYPTKVLDRVYNIDIPEAFEDSDYVVHRLAVKRNLYARVQADANWRVRVFVWFPDELPEPEADGNPSTGGETIFEGNP